MKACMIYSNEIMIENAENVMKRLYDLHFTDIFFIAKNIDGSVFYQSRYAEVVEDKLSIICQMGEKYNINIYAWFCTFIEGYKGKLFGKGISNFLLRNPSYAAVDLHGNTTIEKPVPCDWGFENYACPANPQVQKYEINLMRELARNYPIKGIHLDFIRYPFPGDYCYCEYCRKQFELDLGYSLDDEKGSEYRLAWRQSVITDFVDKLNKEIKELNRNIQISALVWKYDDCLKKTQDWKKWDVDFITPMLYHKGYRQKVGWIVSEIKKNQAVSNQIIIPAVGGPYSSLFTKKEWEEIDKISDYYKLNGILYGHYGLLDIMNTLERNQTWEIKKILIWLWISNANNILINLRHKYGQIKGGFI